MPTCLVCLLPAGGRLDLNIDMLGANRGLIYILDQMGFSSILGLLDLKCVLTFHQTMNNFTFRKTAMYKSLSKSALRMLHAVGSNSYAAYEFDPVTGFDT